MTTVLIILAVVAVLALALRHKVRRDAIHQNGAPVGSAILGGLGQPGRPDAYFVIIRGEPAFDERQPFQHQGDIYLIRSYANLDTGSTVLRRFNEATCRVIGPARE